MAFCWGSVTHKELFKASEVFMISQSKHSKGCEDGSPPKESRGVGPVGGVRSKVLFAKVAKLRWINVCKMPIECTK